MKHRISPLVLTHKVISASRILLAVFIIGLLVYTQWSRMTASLWNNLGSCDLNRALILDMLEANRLARFASAGSKFQKTLNLDDDSGYAYYNLGRIYTYFGDQKSAENVLEKAVHRMPGDTLSLFELGMVKATLGKEQQAMTLWQQAGAAPYFVNNAAALSRENKLNQALHDAQRAITIDPEHHSTHIALGDIYIKQKDYERALQAYQNAVTLAPGDALSQYQLAKTLHSMGKIEQAALTFRRVLLLAPNYPPALHELGSIYAKQEQCEQVGTLIQPLLGPGSSTSNTISALRIVGTCYLNRQNPGLALPYLERLATTDTAQVNDFMHLGQAYEALDNATAAIEVYTHVLLLDPDHASAQQSVNRLQNAE